MERHLDRWREGPEPPLRVAQEVRLFRALHPGATADEWEQYATRHAESAYRQGYIRGFEYNERFWPGPADDPELLAAAMREDAPSLEANPRMRRLLELGYDLDDPFRGMTRDERNELARALASGAVLKLRG